jgi:DNA-binding NarL/FixJ family response regulator
MPDVLNSTPSSDAIRILVAEGHGLARAGLAALLESQPDIRVVAEAATGEEAVEEARRTGPDVVLIDIDLPGLDARDATRRIVDACDGEVAALLLVPADQDDAVSAGLRAGATGLLLKDAEPGELVAAVRVVARGEVLLAPALAAHLVSDYLSRPARLDTTPEQLEELTPREREVVALVACGLSNEEIAARLVVTRATAKTHVSRALLKLDARDRAQLVVLAYETGLVRPGPRRREAMLHRESPASRARQVRRPSLAITPRRALQPMPIAA